MKYRVFDTILDNVDISSFISTSLENVVDIELSDEEYLIIKLKYKIEINDEDDTDDILCKVCWAINDEERRHAGDQELDLEVLNYLIESRKNNEI